MEKHYLTLEACAPPSFGDQEGTQDALKQKQEVQVHGHEWFDSPQEACGQKIFQMIDA